MSVLNYATQSRSVTVPGVDAVLDGQLYISRCASNLTVPCYWDTQTALSISCAKAIDENTSFTHLVSVCPDLPRRNDNHLIIPIQDTEYDNIIDHLSTACDFIDSALTSGGCVLVHCVMGVSRSATVIAAYRTYPAMSGVYPSLRPQNHLSNENAKDHTQPGACRHRTT